MNKDRDRPPGRPGNGRRLLLMLGMLVLAVAILVATLILSFGSRFHPYQAAIVHAPVSVQPGEASPERNTGEPIHDD